jgi:hypothetical protein
MVRSQQEIAKFYENAADELEALANDIRAGGDADLDVFYFLKKTAQKIRSGAGPVASKLTESTTQH